MHCLTFWLTRVKPQVVGGLLLNHQRKIGSPSCESEFAKLILSCSDAVLDVASTSQGLAYGLDPAFNARSSLYDPDVVATAGTYGRAMWCAQQGCRTGWMRCVGRSSPAACALRSTCG